ncbi:MAG: Ig-like domain-containing protein [Pseudomonadota bacterium]
MHKPILALAAAAVLAHAVPARALEVWMTARPLSKAMPDGESVPMWGFAQVTPEEFAATTLVTAATVPGPRIALPEADDTLTIHLRNDLPAPVSIVIPGQRAAPNPTWVDADGAVAAVGSRPSGNVSARMRSTATETPPGGTATYSWTGLRPGTFIYRSGTHPAVQVPMGLHGAMTRAASGGGAYPGIGFDAEVLLHYAEVDPALNRAVTDGVFGTAAYPSTIAYHARYFLVNGTPFVANQAPVPTIPVGGRTLLRLLNAGLETHVPTLLGSTLTAVAEDGHPYPYPRQGHAVALPPGKTVDAVMVAPAAGRYAIFDRMLELTSDGMSPGGLISYVDATASATVAATDDAFSGAEDTVLTVAAPGVLANDTGSGLTAALVAPPGGGELVLSADGGFTFTPAPDFSGGAVFTYRASDGTASSNVASAVLTLAPANDPPISANDDYHGTADQSLAVPAPGVLANDRDIDGDPLAASLVAPPANGTLSLAADGSFTYQPNAGFGGTDRFTYTAADGQAASPPATVTVTVARPTNQAPIAADDKARSVRGRPVTIFVLTNDHDPDGSLNPASVTIATPPNQGGSAVVNANGSITFTPKRRFRGTDVFTYRVSDQAGAASNEAKVSVDVVR